MRELKFRAWDKEYNCMDYDFYIRSDGLTYDKVKITYDTPNLEIEQCDNLLVMQFTGCKDFFGNDIFDGDIVFLDVKMMIGKIESDGISWRINFENDLDWLCDYFEDLHVIGNIYQNPELLENKNENNTNK